MDLQVQRQTSSREGLMTQAVRGDQAESGTAHPEGQPAPVRDPVPADVLATAREGLEPRPQPAKRVIVIGAGLSGLVAAFELRRQGHDPVILEAQHRVGGRIYTLRNFAPGLYAEAGGMRIPRAHDLTLAYSELFGLELRPFTMGNPLGLVFIGDQRMTAAEAEAHPERLPFDFAEHERGRSVNDLWEEATRDLREMVARGPAGPSHGGWRTDPGWIPQVLWGGASEQLQPRARVRERRVAR